MSNMDHCRFTNTLEDLRDCYEHMDDEDLSEAEAKARLRLIKLCVDIAVDSSGEYVAIPKELTAENGAKALLIGEFQEEIELTCSACDYHGKQMDCEVCSGNVTYMQPVDVSWSTIKQIYAKAVKGLAA